MKNISANGKFQAAISELQKKANEFKQKVTDVSDVIHSQSSLLKPGASRIHPLHPFDLQAVQKFNEAKEAAEAKIEEERQKLVDEFKAKLVRQ